MGKEIYPVHKVFMSSEILPGLEEVLSSGRLVDGPLNEKFEHELSSFLKVPLLLSTSANPILLALLALDLDYGDEVAMSPLTCLMATQPLKLLGLKPLWVDIDPCRGSIDPNDLERKISGKTKAVIHFHWCGYPGWLEEVALVCRSKGVTLISDLSQAFGATVNGKSLASVPGPDISCLNFSTVRAPSTINGGALVFSQRELYDRGKTARDLGINREKFRTPNGAISSTYDVSSAGINGKLDEVSAWIGLKNLEEFPALLKKQTQNGTFLNHWCKNNGFRTLNTEGTNPNYWAFTFLAEDQRHAIEESKSIGVHHSKIHHPNNQYSLFSSNVPLPGLEKFMEQQVTVASGWWCDFD